MTDLPAFFERVAAEHPRCFWLDGAGGRAFSGHRSIIGWLEPDDVSLTYDAGRREVTRHAGGRAEVVGDDVFAVLERELAAGPTSDRWVGYLGYASRPDLLAAPDPHQPDAVWMRADPARTRIVEHGPSVQPVRTPASTSAGPPPAAYAAAFAAVQEHLHAGDSYEVNLTYRVERRSTESAVQTYLRLRQVNPAPYAGFLQHDVAGARAWLLSSSPERYGLISPLADGGRRLETRPIKGTTPRDVDPARDLAERDRLTTEPALRAEHLMIVDLLRNDVALVSEVGTVEVPSLMHVESYPGVHQLVSTVRGRLRDDVSTVAALRALFPAGSMTGAPKRRTMAIIDDVEQTPRGPYAGAFGWVDGGGRADLGVVIRSLTTAGDGVYRVGTGGGVTVYSTLAAEHAEAELKASRVLSALTPTTVRRTPTETPTETQTPTETETRTGTPTP